MIDPPTGARSISSKNKSRLKTHLWLLTDQYKFLTVGKHGPKGEIWKAVDHKGMVKASRLARGIKGSKLGKWQKSIYLTAKDSDLRQRSKIRRERKQKDGMICILLATRVRKTRIQRESGKMDPKNSALGRPGHRLHPHSWGCLRKENEGRCGD